MRQKILASCVGIICLFFLFGMKSEATTGINFLKEDPSLAINEAVIKLGILMVLQQMWKKILWMLQIFLKTR